MILEALKMRRRMTIGATIARSNPTSPAIVLPKSSPITSATAVDATAMTTMTAEIRKVRLCAPAVWRTNSSVPPDSPTLMSFATAPPAAANEMIVRRIRTRTTPKSSSRSKLSSTRRGRADGKS